jgi:opacity protein-like surface antigen
VTIKQMCEVISWWLKTTKLDNISPKEISELSPIKGGWMKRIIVLVFCFINLYSFSYAKDNVFVSYQASVLMPEDDNFGYGHGFLAQGVEVGYSWKYIEAGVEYFVSNLKTLHASTFTDNSIIGQVKVKYSLPWKRLNRLTPYAIIGAGAHFFTNEKMKKDPQQPDDQWNYPETIARKSCIALKYGAGVQYKVTDRVSIFTEADYIYGDTGKSSSLDIYSWRYGLGARVSF